MPMPDEFDYACAAAKVLVDDRMDLITDHDLVLGPLFVAGTMPRQPDLEQYLQHNLGVKPSFSERELRRMITHGLHGLTGRFRTNLLSIAGTREHAVFTLNHAALTDPPPSMIQQIVRLAALRVLADEYGDVQDDFVAGLRDNVTRSDFEDRVLQALLERHGEVIYFNRFIKEEPAVRKKLRALARRVNSHYGEIMIDDTTDRNGIRATPAFLRLSGSLPTEDVVAAHQKQFGPYVPVPQLLLHTDPTPTPEHLPYKIKAIEKALLHLTSMQDVIHCDALIAELVAMLQTLKKQQQKQPYKPLPVRTNGTPTAYALALARAEALFHFSKSAQEPVAPVESPSPVVIESRRGDIIHRRTVNVKP